MTAPIPSRLKTKSYRLTDKEVEVLIQCLFCVQDKCKFNAVEYKISAAVIHGLLEVLTP